MSEPNPPPPPPVATAYEFPSLSALKAAHYRLLEAEEAAEDAESPNASFLEDVRSFARRASASGRVLEGEERGVAQTLLNYWATVLIRAGQSENLPTSLADHDETAGRDLDESLCPYIGLDAHTAQTAHLFYGRRKSIADWTRVLAEKRLLVIYGPSGAGKSSLIAAGLVPAFLQSRADGQEWKVLASPQPGADATESLEEVLRAEEGTDRVVLALLRFDEALRYAQESRRKALLEKLAAWLSAPGRERRAIAGSRSDAATTLKPWVEEKGRLGEVSAQVFLPAFQAAELREVIEEPANRIGLRFEEGLVETLVNEFLGEPSALALLQFTLLKLWALRERNRITWAAYKKIGGAQFVVEQAAEEVYLAPDFSDKDRQLIERVFLRLVRPGFARELVLCMAPVETLAATPAERARVPVLVARFAGQGILRVREGGRSVAVAHEALVRKWSRLEKWLDVARLQLLDRQRIGEDALAWREGRQAAKLLLSGGRLESAVAVLPLLPPADQEFVQASAATARRNRNLKRAVMVGIPVLLAALLLRENHHAVAEREVGIKNKVELSLERAERRVDEGDPAGAFLLFQKAYADDERPRWKQIADFFSPQAWGHWPPRWHARLDPVEDQMHKLRLGATLRPLPRLADLYSLPKLVHVELAPDGKSMVGISPSQAAIWRFAEGPAPLSAEPAAGPLALKPLPAGAIAWAAFHPKEPLIALVAAEAGRGQVIVFDAGTGRRTAFPPIKIADGQPQKAWFAPGAVGEALLVITELAGQPAGRRAQVSMWNYRTGELMAGPLAHALPINWAAFSPDGELVVTAAGDLGASGNGEAQVWAWREPALLPHEAGRHLKLPHDGGPIAYAEFNPAGNQVVTADGADEGEQGAARVWSVEGGRGAELKVGAITTPLNHQGAVTRAHFSPDGVWVASASRDRTARIWHIATQKPVMTMQHEGDVNDALFSPDGRLLATASRDRTAALWEVATGQRLLAPLDHAATVSELAFGLDGRRLLTASQDLIRWWNLEANDARSPILASRKVVEIAVSRDGQRFFTVSVGNAGKSNLELWETASGQRLAKAPPSDLHILHAALSADGNRVAVAGRMAGAGGATGGEPKLQILEARPGLDAAPGALEEVASLGKELRHQEVTLLAFNPQGDHLAMALRSDGDQGSAMAIYDCASRTLTALSLGLPLQKPALVSQLQFSPKGKFLLAFFTRADDPAGYGRVWALDGSPSPKTSEVTHESALTTASFSEDEKWLLTGSTDDNVRQWPIIEGRVLAGQSLLALKRKEQPSGRKEAAPPKAGLHAGKAEAAHTHTADITKVLYSPDGRRALTAAKDQTAILWQFDERGNASQVAILPHGASVSDAAFSDDNRLLLTASEEPTLRVWSASQGKLIALFTPPGRVLKCGFTAGDAEGGSPPRPASPAGLFAIGQRFASRPAGTKKTAEAVDEQPLTREVRPMTWSIKPLDMQLPDMAVLGQVIAARQVTGEGLEKMETARLPRLWEQEREKYAAQFNAARSPQEFHEAAAVECEVTEQWSAAAWHLSRLLEIEPAPKLELRKDWLTRRADAYAKTDDRPGDLPKCIADHQALIDLEQGDADAHASLADVCMKYGAELADAQKARAQFDRAISELTTAVSLAPQRTDLSLELGEAYAGERDFPRAEKALNEALQLRSTSATARLATISWLAGDEAGKERYRALCRSMLDPKTDPRVAYSLLWPSVLTNAFAGPEGQDFRDGLVKQARRSLEERPANLFRRNTYGAALYRAGQYAEAVKQLEEARSAYLAERVNELARHYDHLLRVPLFRPAEGRPEDWLFLAMVDAKLYESDPVGQAARRIEMWDWMRKAMDAPELARLSDQRPEHRPVLYRTLALELLYYEASDLLRSLSKAPPKPK